MADDIVENLKKPTQWFRIAFMIALSIALYLAGMVLTLLIIAQALFGLLTGADNRNLRELGAGLTHYVRQVLDFLTYNSEFKPFPFAPFPGGEVSPEADMFATEEGFEQDVEVHVPEGDRQPSVAVSEHMPKAPRKRSSTTRSSKSRPSVDGE
jgi:hypothetical protein